MINIITSGCSFTHDPVSWANILSEELSGNYTVTNVAQGGVGQEYITRSAISALNNVPDKKICIVQLSSSYRVEFIIDKKENPNLYEKVKVNHGKDFFDKIHQTEYRTFWPKGTTPGRQWYRLNDDTILLIRTTDVGHEWYNKNTEAGKMVNSINNLISLDQRLMWTYEHLARLQWYCKINNIPLFCFYGWRCMSNPYNVELVERSSCLIDWNNVWLYDKDGGMADWMTDQGHHGKLDEDHTNKPPQGWTIVNGKKIMIGHPTAEAHRDFCKQIIIPWIGKND